MKTLNIGAGGAWRAPVVILTVQVISIQPGALSCAGNKEQDDQVFAVQEHLS